MQSSAALNLSSDDEPATTPPSQSAAIQWLPCICGADWLTSQHMVARVRQDGKVDFPNFSTTLQVDAAGVPALGNWKLNREQSSQHFLKWESEGNIITWQRVLSPPTTQKPWRVGTTINFLYASEGSHMLFTRRVAVVRGYKSFAQGPAVFTQLAIDGPGGEPRTFYLAKMFDVKQ
eukprot:2147737-Karenia_brevis.AAC.1